MSFKSRTWKTFQESQKGLGDFQLSLEASLFCSTFSFLDETYTSVFFKKILRSTKMQLNNKSSLAFKNVFPFLSTRHFILSRRHVRYQTFYKRGQNNLKSEKGARLIFRRKKYNILGVLFLTIARGFTRSQISAAPKITSFQTLFWRSLLTTQHRMVSKKRGVRRSSYSKIIYVAGNRAHPAHVTFSEKTEF